MAQLIPEEIVESIRNAADILDVVSESVQLKKTGHNFMGLCPFHSEKTPSFSVNPQRGIFHCFGCGLGGNVFSFVMKRDGISFPESVRLLAAKYGIHIPEREMDPATRKSESERESIYAVNKMAMEFFSNILFDSQDGNVAREYLKKRDMNGFIAKEFNLGYIPEGWDRLTRYLSSRKVPRHIAEKSGLVVSKNGERYYDRFRNRIIFPILDQSQRVLGFGGRVLDTSLPKYLNSPETMVYNKSRSLYGFHRTRSACRETETVHIVEGYFDLLALYMSGVENVVATLGTALTRDHVRLLSRSGVKKFVLVFDSDSAGVKAAERSIPVFQKEYISANILVLPEPHDPDTFIREYGRDTFISMSEKAMGIIPFLTDSAVRKHGLSVEGRISIINEMKPALAMVEDPVALSIYVRELAGRIGVDEKAVLERVKEHVPGESERYHTSHTVSRKAAVDPGTRYNGMEKQIVAMMLQYSDIIPECRENRVVDFFEESDLKMIGKKIMNYSGDSGAIASVLMTQAEHDEERKLIAALAIGDIPYLYKNCINLIKRFVATRRKSVDRLTQQIRQAEETGDHDLLLKLIHEKNSKYKTLRNQTNLNKRQ